VMGFGCGFVAGLGGGGDRFSARLIWRRSHARTARVAA
jgi:hypothetical protein